jgi:hypothetical protein
MRVDAAGANGQAAASLVKEAGPEIEPSGLSAVARTLEACRTG